MSDVMKKELSININTNVDTEPIKKAKSEIQSFRQECETNSIKLGIDKKSLQIDTRGFYKAINAAKALEDQLHVVQKTAPKMMGALEDANSGFGFANNFREELKDAMVAFDDGSIVNGFDNIVSKISEGFKVVAVDLGNRSEYLKAQITEIIGELKSVGAVESNAFGVFGFSGDNMDNDQLKNRIVLIENLLQAQKELEIFKGKKFKHDEAPSGMSSSALEGQIRVLKSKANELEKYNLRTTEQLKRRAELIQEANATWQWDDDDHSNAKDNIKDDGEYESAIASLEWYINQRKETIQKLKDNEDELFSVDGITEYVNNANEQIERFQRQKLELQNLRKGKTDDPQIPLIGDFSGVISQLEEIKTAINGIREAFEPLTKALSTEDSALGAMVKANIADLEVLNSKVNEAFNNIEKLSNKDFNITNVLSDGKNNQTNVEQVRQFRQEAKLLFDQVQELYNEAITTGSKLNSGAFGPVDLTSFANTMSDFDLTDLAKRIKSRSASSLGIVIDELNEWKKVLLQFNSLRNNVEAGSFNASKYNDTSSKVKIGSKTTDKDDNTLVEKNMIDNEDILNRVRNLSEQIKSEFDSIRSKIEEVFNFATINPNVENINSIINEIFKKFEDLQTKINSLEFNIQAPKIVDNLQSESDDIKDAADSMTNEGNAAEDAVPKKNAFAEANRKAAESGKATEVATKGAADGIKAEADAVEQATSSFDKVSTTFDNENKPLYKTETKSKVGQDSVDTTTKSYIYKDDEDDEGWKLSTETIVKDFKKRASELKKESDKIALAQKTVDKFVSQFESKTAGQASKIKGFDGENGLKGFTIKSLDDIEIATQKMIELDAEYNKLTKSFRQGTKSMNPFVNAITGIGEMENKIQEVEIAFNNLNTKPEKLSKEVDNLIPLFSDMMSFISEDENGNRTITDIYGMAEAYGKLNAALRQVSSNIKIQKQIDASKTKDVNFGLDLEKQFSAMSKQQAQWEKNGQLTDELRQKINGMFDSLANVANSSELTAWKRQWSILKDEVMETKYQIEAAKKAQEPANKKEAQDKAYWDGRFKESVDGLITPEKRPELEQIKASMLQQAAATEESVVEQYDTIMTIITQKNNALQKLMSAKGPEEQKYWQDQYSAWFGVWNALDKDVLSKFFEDAGNQAILGAEKIDKFNVAVEQSKILAAKNKDDAKNKADKEADIKQKDLGTSVSNAYKEYTQAIIKLKKLQTDTSGKDHTNEIRETIQDIQDAKKKLSELGIDVNKIAENTVLTEKQTNELLEQRIAYKKELRHIDSQAADDEVNKLNKEAEKYGKTLYNRESKYRDIIDSNIRSIGEENLNDDFLKKIEQYKEAYKNFQDLRNIIINNPIASDELKDQFQDAALVVEKLRKEVFGVFKESQKFENIPKDSLLGVKALDPSKFQDMKAALAEYGAEITAGKLKIEGFNESNTEMYGVIDKGAGVFERITVALKSGTNTLYAYQSGTKQISDSWQQLGDKLKSGVKGIIGQYVGFHEAVQVLRQGFTYVKEIDLAMTELKKVTDETDGTYSNFLKTASSVSGEIGSTISDFTNATAAFARLGHSIDESTSMAESAIVYKNVADGLDTIEASTDSIISTMMAFGIEANDTMSIVDKFNAVGNSFAITSAGIGDALQRSASALYSAGNSIDESVALVTAANSVIQNPEQVGTALKTLALRLRGAKVELEDAGLETDNMAESTSQLQDKLLALTHGKVDIMLDADTFKNTTQILREMSGAWEDMTDIERASALELMGGKRQANILSSVITNFETVEDVIETSINSYGSAIAENEKWLDSIEGKTYQFTNALQTMWSNMIDSQTVKGFLNFGTDIIKFLDTVPGKITAVVGAIAGIAKFNGFSIKGLVNDLNSTINRITTAQQALQTLGDNTTVGKGFDFTNINAYAQAVANLTAKQQANLLASQGLNQEQIRYALTLNQVDDASMREAMAHVHAASAKEQEAASGSKLIQQKAVEVAASLKIQAAKDGEARSTELNAAADILENSTSESLTAAKLTEAMTSQNVSAATQAEIFAKLGLTNANKGLAASIKALYAVNPVGFWVTVISTILSLIPLIGELADAFTTSNEEIQEAASQAKSAIESISSEFKENEKFVSSNAKRFAELAQGVDMLSGKNLSLSADDYEEFLSLSNQLAEVFPTLSRNYDENGNAIVQLSGDANTMVSSLENLLDVQRQMAQQKIVDNIPDLYAGVKQQSDAYRTEIGTFESNIKRYQNLLDSLKENDMTSIINSLFSTRKLQYDGSAQSTMLVENIKNILDNLGIKTLLNESIDGNGDITGYTLELLSSNSAEQLQDAKNRISVGIDAVAQEYNKKMNELNSDIQKTTNENKANWSSLSASIASWLETDSTYKILDDQTKSMLQTVVNNLDYSHLNLKSWDEAKQFIQDNIMSLFTDEDIKDDLSKQLTDMFDIQADFKKGDMPLDDYKNQIQSYVDFVQGLDVEKDVKDNLLKLFTLDPDEVTKGNTTLGESVDTMLNHAKSIVDTSKETIESELKRLGKDGAVDLLVRPKVDASQAGKYGWKLDKDEIATVLSRTVSNEDETIAMNFTPIIADENGNFERMLTPDEFTKYTEEVVAGAEDTLNLKIGATYEGEDAIEKAEQDARTISELHDKYFLDNMEIPFDQLTYSDLQVINSDQFNVDGSVIASWEQLQNEIREAKIAMTQDFTVANYADYAEDIGKVSSNIATYKEALENLGSGSFTMEDFVELISQFPDLADGVDVASGEFKGLAKNLAKAIKNSPDDLVDDLKDLKQELSDAGKETDAIDNLIKSLEDMPDDALDGALDKYGELIDVINAAKAAQEALNAAMSQNPNEGFETRGNAIDQMKTLMEQGMIGSESELWDIAEAYGFTYESANSIEQNADALYEFITAREKWYKTDKDGNYTFDGTEDFIESAENAINSDKFKTALQKALGKEGDESFNVADYIKWDYEDGVFDFDFDNENWDAIVKALGETSELAGLTSEEFKDLLTQIGMFFDVNWQDASDVSSHIAKIAEGSGTTEEKIKDMKNAVEAFIKESEGVELDLDDPNANISDFSKEIQDLIKQYLELKDEVLSSEKNFDNANKKLKELGKTDIDFNADTTDIEDLNSQIEEAQKILDSFKDSDGNIDISADGAEEAQLILKKLLRQKQLLEQPAVMKVKVADDGSNIDQTIQKVQEFKNAYDKLELEIAIGGDVDSAQEEVDKIQEELKGMDADILAKINIDPTASAETINAQIMAIKPEVLASIGLGDTSAVESYSPEVTGMVKWSEDTSAVSTSFTATGTVNWTNSNGPGGVNGTAHAQGTAYKTGSWGAETTETALVGELGPELLVRNGRWTTIGQDGAEFTQIKKGDIIFNHKQTKSLLENGYVTGRGRAYAEGTAFASGNSKFKKYKFSDTSGSEIGNASNKLSKAAKDISDASEEFAEVFDWIEVRLEEINERIDLKSAKLDNAVGSKKQNGIIDDIIDLNRDLYDNLKSGASKYNSYAKQLLNNIPAEYRKAAQDGSIAIESFTGEVSEKTLKAIEEYRDWVQKGADATQQAEEVLAEISALAKEAFDNIVNEYDNKTSIQDSKNDQYEAHNEYIKTDQGTESEAIYQAQIKENNKKINTLGEKRNKMQAELDKRVESGEIKKYSDDWYDAVNEIAAVDTEIINLKTDNENLQDTVNDLHWENFDNLMSRIESVSDEAENLVDILGTKDLFDKDTGEWTDEGIASLGLYAQQMENAEMQAKKYEEEIDYLNKNWQALGYTEQEYLEKLDELKDGQYDAIKAYHDSKDAIVDLNKERVDAIKEGIEKEIEAYEELIEKKQEELDAEKDLYDFQKNINNQQKEISNVERKLAALEGDNSASARAQRAKLQAELAELQQELQDTYYERSVSDQQEALDKELENFQKEKEKEIEGWDEYLENTETVVSDSLAVVQANTSAVYTTLDKMGKEYSLSISEALTSPWKDGEKAIQSYSEKFGLAASSTVDQFKNIEKDYEKTTSNIEKSGKESVKQVDANSKKYTSATKKDSTSSSKKTESKKEIKVGGKINAGSAKIYSSTSDKTGSKQYYSSDPIYQVLGISGNWVKVRYHKLSNGTTGWFKKSQIKAYAKGTKSVDKDQLALIDELGEELQLIPDGNGRLTYLKKGTSVIPADLTSNLMEWGKLDPSMMLNQNRPQIAMSPSVVNNAMEISIDASVGELIHVDTLNGNNPAEVVKIVDKAWDKYMKELNGHIRRYVK